MDAMVRLADRVVIQTGTGLGEIRDKDGAIVPAEIVALTAVKWDELRAALATAPRGDVHMDPLGAIMIDPPRPPTPEQQAVLDQTAADEQICRLFYQAANGAPTNAQRDAAIKAFMRLVRRELAQ